jgi:hypothetical protein
MVIETILIGLGAWALSSDKAQRTNPVITGEDSIVTDTTDTKFEQQEDFGYQCVGKDY